MKLSNKKWWNRSKSQEKLVRHLLRAPKWSPKLQIEIIFQGCLVLIGYRTSDVNPARPISFQILILTQHDRNISRPTLNFEIKVKYLVQLIKHPIFRIPKFLFIYFWVFFQIQVLNQYQNTPKTANITCYIKKKKNFAIP